MKPNELMIGDYIMLNENIYIIEEISKKGWAHIIYNDGSKCRVALSSDYILDDITPIPLTPEILEKNGWFSLDEYRYEGDIALAKGRNYFRLKNTTICINSVHELQHALRLCGIDKEIEL